MYAMGIWGEGMLLDIPNWIVIVLGAAWLPVRVLALSCFIESLRVPRSADPLKLMMVPA